MLDSEKARQSLGELLTSLQNPGALPSGVIAEQSKAVRFEVDATVRKLLAGEGNSSELDEFRTLLADSARGVRACAAAIGSGPHFFFASDMATFIEMQERAIARLRRDDAPVA